MKQIFSSFLTMATLLLTLSASANPREFGGGCMAGDVLCDIAQNEGTTEISKKDLANLIDPFLTHLENDGLLIGFFFENQIGKKDWLIETKPFDLTKCAPQLSVIMPMMIHACQDSVSVRIEQAWWEKASDGMRIQLVVHEIVLMYAMENKLDENQVYKIVRELFNSKKPMEKRRNEMAQHGFVYFPMVAEQVKFVEWSLPVLQKVVANGKTPLTRTEIQQLEKSLLDPKWAMSPGFYETRRLWIADMQGKRFSWYTKEASVTALKLAFLALWPQNLSFVTLP